MCGECTTSRGSTWGYRTPCIGKGGHSSPVGRELVSNHHHGRPVNRGHPGTGQLHAPCTACTSYCPRSARLRLHGCTFYCARPARLAVHGEHVLLCTSCKYCGARPTRLIVHALHVFLRTAYTYYYVRVGQHVLVCKSCTKFCARHATYASYQSFCTSHARLDVQDVHIENKNYIFITCRTLQSLG